MDEDLKIVLVCIVVIMAFVLALVIPANWRWRLNKKDFYITEQKFVRSGYVQRAVPTDYEIIWVKDANVK